MDRIWPQRHRKERKYYYIIYKVIVYKFLFGNYEKENDEFLMLVSLQKVKMTLHVLKKKKCAIWA